MIPAPIAIHIIEHAEHRIPNTAGDWYFDGHTLVIAASKLPEARESWCLAAHELVEALLCTAQGITPEQVDAFDLAFTGDGEPGDLVDAPYHHAHQLATAVERLLAFALGVDWNQYEADLDALFD